jgi:putative ABC transport system permease protein
MLNNLFRTAIRHILKYSGYSILNLTGLTLGISSALFLIIYVSDELSFDRYHEKAGRIYRVSAKMTQPDAQFTLIRTMATLGPQAVEDYPEIQSFVRFTEMPDGLYKSEDKAYHEENFVYADSTLFDIFTYKVIKGDVKTAIREPNKIILTEKTAGKYFGETDPIGKTLKTGTKSFEVAGVIEDIPFNSHYRFEAVASWSNLPKDFPSWFAINTFTYLLFPDNFDVKTFEIKMQGMYDRYIKPILGPQNLKVGFILEPITRIHLYSTSAAEPEPTGSVAYVYIFSIVALFLVLIAAMNYINLATARSARRACEIGLRKVMGSQRGPLMLQFLSESIVLTFIALILSIIVLIVLLPRFNLLAAKSFDIHIIFSLPVILTLSGIMFLVGILGGTFPAFTLSGLSPDKVLKGELIKGSAGSRFRKILVVVQFSVSVIMIICMLVIYKQLNYMEKMDQGYDQKNVIDLYLNREMVNKYPVLKQILRDNPDIIFVTSTDAGVGSGSNKSWFNVETDQGMLYKIFNCALCDQDFVKTLGIKIAKGRDFQQDMRSDSLAGVIVNESFVNQMGWSEPVGKKVETGNFNGVRARVIGVMHDYHQTGMYNSIEPLILILRERNSHVYIKHSGRNSRLTLDYIEKKWKDIFPGQPFSYKFLSERFKNQFKGDEKRALIFTLFTLLAICIACLGLFGLVSYTVEQRTKEIGIRKVFGADGVKIMKLISKDFLMLVFFGILIAVPVAYYTMNNWLQKYAYRTSIGMFLILAAALSTILITFITIGFKVFRASLMNPATSIRTE